MIHLQMLNTICKLKCLNVTHHSQKRFIIMLETTMSGNLIIVNSMLITKTCVLYFVIILFPASN